MAADESGQATVVSNSSSRDSFVGLGYSNDVLSGWDQSNDPFDTSAMSMYSSINNSNDNNNIIMSEKPSAIGHLDAQSNATHSTSTIISTMPSNFTTSLIVSKGPLPILPSAGLAVPSAPANNTVPEFLYQLTKMLTGGHNDIIEWSNGRIEVHNPHKLESTVLQKYFRHSKFASFQRQLNYFGFRKLAGKGKMAPCSYVNEAATPDIGSLLLIKRKATVAPKEKNGRKLPAEKTGGKAVHPPISNSLGVPNPTKIVATRAASVSYDQNAGGGPEAPSSQQAIAQAAVGRGIRHSLGLGGTGYLTTGSGNASNPATNAVDSTKFLIPMGVEDSLSQLASNYQNSLAGEHPLTERAQGTQDGGSLSSYSLNDPFPSLLSRNSSLIDLAFIPSVEDGEQDMPTIPGMHFVDFPQPEVDPSNKFSTNNEEQSS